MVDNGVTQMTELRTTVEAALAQAQRTARDSEDHHRCRLVREMLDAGQIAKAARFATLIWR